MKKERYGLDLDRLHSIFLGDDVPAVPGEDEDREAFEEKVAAGLFRTCKRRRLGE